MKLSLLGRLDVGCGDDGDGRDVHDEHANQEPACGWSPRYDGGGGDDGDDDDGGDGDGGGDDGG